MTVFSELFIGFYLVQHFTGEEILLFSLVPVKPNPSQDSSTDQQAEPASLKYFKEIYEVDKGQPTNNVLKNLRFFTSNF